MKVKPEAIPFISVSNLAASYSGQVILDNINFSLKQGEVLAVVGGSGAGKTTLLRSLLGLNLSNSHNSGMQVSGQGQLMGKVFDLAQQDNTTSSLKDRVAYVPQNPSAGLDPLKRLAWQWRQALQVIIGKSAYPADRIHREGSSLLSQLSLKAFENNYPHQWSRGMQQRLLIAFALTAIPDLLILDEPTSALDPIIAAKVLAEVLELARKKNICVLLVTHDLGLAAKYADRLAVLAKGKIIETGQVSDVLQSPQSTYTKELVEHLHWKRHHA